MTLEFELAETALFWPCLRLVDEGWCSLVEMKGLTFDDLDLATDALDALARARHDAEKNR